MNFSRLLDKLKHGEFSKREHGDRFERLIQLYLMTDPKYAPLFDEVWMWNDFPYKTSFGVSTDTGIDLVALTKEKEFWAIQCKFYGSDKTISKSDLDKFLSASGREFYDEEGNEERFSNRLFVSTTDKWSSTAEETIRNQQPPVQRISLFDLQDAPVDWKKLDAGLFGEDSRTEKYTLKPHQKDAPDEYFIGPFSSINPLERVNGEAADKKLSEISNLIVGIENESFSGVEVSLKAYKQEYKTWMFFLKLYLGVIKLLLYGGIVIIVIVGISDNTPFERTVLNVFIWFLTVIFFVALLNQLSKILFMPRIKLLEKEIQFIESNIDALREDA